MKFLTALVLLVACAAACSGPSDRAADSTPVPPTAGSGVSSPSPTPAPTAAPNPPPADETKDTADFPGTAGNTNKPNPKLKNTAILKAIRTARHGNFDRLVFEFEGAELPGYQIEYIDKPVRSCGSGEVVPLAGDGWLLVRFTPAAAHTEAGEPTLPARELKPGLPIILEAKSTCDFEADVEWVFGVSSPNKYRVLELKAPTRLAVDIKH